MSYVTEQDVRDLLKVQEGPTFHGHPPWVDELGKTWGFGPITDRRGGLGTAEEINIQVLLESLRKKHFKGWAIYSASHWGFGWVEQLVFQVLEPGETEFPAYPGFRSTAVCREVIAWRDALREDPILDEEAYYKALHEEQVEMISRHLPRDLIDEVPADHVEQIHRKIRDDFYETDGSQWVDPRLIAEACDELGWLTQD